MSRVRFSMVSLAFFIDKSLSPQYGPRICLAPNRNEYQEYLLGGKGGQCLGLTILSVSCAECLEIWQAQLPGTLRVSNRTVLGLLFFHLISVLSISFTGHGVSKDVFTLRYFNKNFVCIFFFIGGWCICYRRYFLALFKSTYSDV